MQNVSSDHEFGSIARETKRDKMKKVKTLTMITVCVSAIVLLMPSAASAQSAPRNWDECFTACMASGNRDGNFCAIACYDRFPDDGGEGGGKGKGPSLPDVHPCWGQGDCLYVRQK
jgi:hypothetical protein